jgi:hypothetical protein
LNPQSRLPAIAAGDETFPDQVPGLRRAQPSHPATAVWTRASLAVEVGTDIGPHETAVLTSSDCHTDHLLVLAFSAKLDRSNRQVQFGVS